METRSDHELAHQAASGDAVALDLLINRHYRDMYRAAFRWCRNQHNAEDITHEACIKLARAIGSYRGEASFRTWLYRIVINCAKDFTRSQRPKDMQGLIDSEWLAETIMGGQEDAAQLNQIARWFDALKPSLREAAWLVYAEGLTHSEAAKVLNCAEATVSWRLMQVRKELTVMKKGGKA